MDLRQRRYPAAKSTFNHNNNHNNNNTKTNSKNSTQDNNSNTNDVLGTPTIIILGILATLLLSYSGYYIGSNYREQLDDKLYYNLKQDTHTLENLNCVDHNGPYTGSYYKGKRSTLGIEQEVVNEMVYWNDIPSDSNFVSPFHPSRIPRDDTAVNNNEEEEDEEKFLSFEPDRAGWNNMRMSFETVVVLAAATGRTLVIPNEKKITQIKQKKHAYKKGEEQQYKFSFQDFFHLDAISREHSGVKIITIGEFLKREAVAGKLYNKYTDKVAYPPGNFTIFDKGVDFDWYPLYYYLRSVGVTPKWNPNDCFLAIPSSPGQEAIDIINSTWHSLYNGSAIINGTDGWFRKDYINNPIPVNSNMKERMREMVGDRDEICIYDTEMQDAKLLHIQSKDGVRLLTHFYAFIFFADWKQDTWSKRFVRDHLRIRDEITCAAARVIVAVREHARKNAEKNSRRLGITKKNSEGLYDAFHVRRGDFADQFEKTQISAEEMYNSSKDELTEGTTLYIATQEKDKTFFNIFKEHYDVVFLDDFISQIGDLNTNLLGLVDMLVASKSEVFFGTYYSTFSGYINRLRGYHAVKNKLEGYENGVLKSWYFSHNLGKEKGAREFMRHYEPIYGWHMWKREFPTCWRDIDTGVKEKKEKKLNDRPLNLWGGLTG